MNNLRLRLKTNVRSRIPIDESRFNMMAGTLPELEEIRKKVLTQNVVVRDSLRADWMKRYEELRRDND